MHVMSNIMQETTYTPYINAFGIFIFFLPFSAITFLSFILAIDISLPPSGFFTLFQAPHSLFFCSFIPVVLLCPHFLSPILDRSGKLLLVLASTVNLAFWPPMTILFFFSRLFCLFKLGFVSDQRRVGRVNYCWFSPAQRILVPIFFFHPSYLSCLTSHVFPFHGKYSVGFRSILEEAVKFQPYFSNSALGFLRA